MTAKLNDDQMILVLLKILIYRFFKANCRRSDYLKVNQKPKLSCLLVDYKKSFMIENKNIYVKFNLVTY